MTRGREAVMSIGGFSKARLGRMQAPPVFADFWTSAYQAIDD